jgi:hypothetical protein
MNTMLIESPTQHRAPFTAGTRELGSHTDSSQECNKALIWNIAEIITLHTVHVQQPV